jgi:RimJ/RimL family protein N-acetyltransferase
MRGEHLDALYAALGRPGTEDLWTYLPVGPFADLDGFRAPFEAMITASGWVPVVITPVGDDAPAGLAAYLRVDEGNGCVEMGSIVLAPSLQRTVAATEAMYLMARYALDELGYRRYEWKCDLLNASSMAAARRLGFMAEGVWRQATVYKGRNRDTAWFSITDADWRALRPVLEAWLAPETFVDGVQRRSLSEATARVRADLDARA